jgi:hypothetical protein
VQNALCFQHKKQGFHKCSETERKVLWRFHYGLHPCSHRLKIKINSRTAGYNFFDPKRNEEIWGELKLEPVDEKLRRYKSNWLLHITTLNNYRMPNVTLNYRPHGRSRLGIALQRVLDEDETGQWRPNSWRMMMMTMTMRKVSRGDFQDFVLCKTYFHISIVFLNYNTWSEGNIQVKTIFFEYICVISRINEREYKNTDPFCTSFLLRKERRVKEGWATQQPSVHKHGRVKIICICIGVYSPLFLPPTIHPSIHQTVY